MLHFFDMLHVKVLPEEGVVVLSVRVSDTRVDEYRFGVEPFREMTEAYKEYPADWTGPDALMVKVDTTRRLASLSIAISDTKREVHRIGQSQFEAMTAQFRAQDMRG